MILKFVKIKVLICDKDDWLPLTQVLILIYVLVAAISIASILISGCMGACVVYLYVYLLAIIGLFAYQYNT